ncbi:MFS transporter [Chloroflexota bacterium]
MNKSEDNKNDINMTKASRRLMLGDRATAGTIIGTHTMTHLYSRGFYIMVPLIYQQLGLVPIQAGLMDAIRWTSSGLSGIFVGFIVDMYRHRRGLFLGLSMIMLSAGYFLVSLASTYWLIILALIFAHIGSAMWHPPGIGLISELFPKRRGLFIALHRATGSLGDTAGPLLVGFLLVTLTWQQTLQAALPISASLGIVLLVLLWNAGGPRIQTVGLKNNLQNQMASVRKAARGSGLLTLLAVSALRGMGDRALILFIPLYLSQNLKMDTLGIGFHMGLLTLLGIASGPIVGAISDRVGRKPMITMALFISAIFPIMMVNSGSGIGLTISIALFGLFLYSVNSLVQAAAMDLAEGMKLEGSFIGMLWGNNALFGAISPIIGGAMAGIWGFQVVFYYAAAIFLIGGLLALRLPLRKVRQYSG